MSYFPNLPNIPVIFTTTVALTLFLSFSVRAEIKPCLIFQDGSTIRCLKDSWKPNGDDFGRVGIINRSECPRIRFMKQEWRQPCGSPASANGTIERVYGGEVLKFGDFQQDMVQDYVQLKSCGQLRLLDCRCGNELVKCGDALWVVTYTRGEHIHLVRQFRREFFPTKPTTTRKPCWPSDTLLPCTDDYTRKR